MSFFLFIPKLDVKLGMVLISITEEKKTNERTNDYHYDVFVPERINAENVEDRNHSDRSAASDSQIEKTWPHPQLKVFSTNSTMISVDLEVLHWD